MSGTEKVELDETSQLYYHARTGFYHDPQAGCHYSCKDGLYYKFENGTYVPMESFQDGCCEMNNCEGIAPAESNKDEMGADISISEHLEETNCKLPENPPLPSECGSRNK